MMLNRRIIVGLLAAAAAGAAPLHAADTPEAVVTRLYAAQQASLAGAGKPVFADEARWPEFLSPALAQLWRKINSRVRAGAANPVTVDPFTGTAQSDVAGVRLSREESDEDSATVLASFRRSDGEGRVAYTLVLTPAGWRIDDAAFLAEGRRWSLRRALSGQRQRR